jgi:hypothetical protein
MSFDGRIRAALTADAADLQPATDLALERILKGGPRRRVGRTIARSLAIAAVISASVLGPVAVLRVIDHGRAPSPAGRGAVGAGSMIDGGWSTTLSIEDGLAAGLGYGRARQLSGPRQLELARGVVRQIRPGSFQTVPVNGTFEVNGPFLIVQDEGETLVLRWRLSGDELRLWLVDDSRSGQALKVDRLIWTTHPWKQTG